MPRISLKHKKTANLEMLAECFQGTAFTENHKAALSKGTILSQRGQGRKTGKEV